MIAEGTYLATAVSAANFINAGQKGTPGVEVEFQLDEGPNTGELITWTGWLTDAARARTSEALAACGYDGAHDESVRGRKAKLVIRHEEYEGRTRARVAFINDVDRMSGAKPMSAVEKAAAKEAIRGLVLSAKSAVRVPDTKVRF
jgi:hypothetical protein